MARVELLVAIFTFSIGIGCADDTVDVAPCTLYDKNCNAFDESYANDACFTAIRNHVQEELKASIQYLAMGAYFNQDHVNRQGVAHFFFDSASEERQHAKTFIKYLMMRGNSNTTIIGDISPAKTAWNDVLDAFKDALDLEKKVTRRIHILTKDCSFFNEFHAADFLTTEFLDEQLKGVRDLSGKIANLKTMIQRQPNLGEFLFDLELQSH